jgi:hypothetical protein
VQIRSVYDLVSEWGYREGTTIGVKTAGSSHALKNLAEAIKATISGQLPVDPVKKRGLCRIFNAVAKKLAMSRLVRKEIQHLFDNEPHKRPPSKPAPGTPGAK